MKIIEAAGSPTQIGHITGEALREEIAFNAEIDRARLDRNSDVWPKRYAGMIEGLKANLPAVYDELVATAEASNQPFEIIAYMNSGKTTSKPLPFDACTNACFADGPDGPVLGKNNDGLSVETTRKPCVRIVKPVDGIPQLTVTFAGWLAVCDGINAEGVAVGHSSVGSKFAQLDHWLPIRLWYYHVMSQARSTGDFVRLMMSAQLNGKGYAMVVVDRACEAVSVEAAVPVIQMRKPGSAKGHVNCTNYYQLPELTNADTRKGKTKCDAEGRRAMLDRELDLADPSDVAAMAAVLKLHPNDRGEHPGVCRHFEEAGTITEYSMMFLPRDGRVFVADGQPCSNEYAELQPFASVHA